MCAAANRTPEDPIAQLPPEKGFWRELLRKSKQPYGQIVILFVLITLLAYGLAFSVFHHGAAYEISFALGEAFLVALLLLVGGHAYLQGRLVREAEGRGLVGGIRGLARELFGFTNEDYPAELEASVQSFADQPVYLEYANWAIDFSWENDPGGVLVVTLNLESRGRCVSKKGFELNTPLWFMPSIPGKESTYLHYSLQCAEGDINATVKEGEFNGYFNVNEEQPALYLNQERILRDKSSKSHIEHRQWFNFNRQVRVYLNSTDSAPLIHSRFELLFNLSLSGDALRDLCVSAVHPGESWTYHGGSPDSSHSWRTITPGQATFLSWRPANAATGMPEVALSADGVGGDPEHQTVSAEQTGSAEAQSSRAEPTVEHSRAMRRT